MSKKRHESNEATNSSTTMIIMAVCAVAVLALVGWALTRTVEPARTVVPESAAVPAPVATAPTADAATPPPAAATTPPAAVNATSADIHPETGIERISVEDFRAKYDAGNIVVIDVRDSSSYATGHIPGAMNIPFASVQGFTDMIPKGKEIVTYCT